MAMSALIVIRAIAIFASPIGINRILQCVLAVNESLAYADVKPLQLLRDRRRWIRDTPMVLDPVAVLWPDGAYHYCPVVYLHFVKDTRSD